MKQLILSSLILAGTSTPLLGQAFVYHPNNPNFGGNTFNYSWMLSQAQAQDRTKDPTTPTNRTTTTSTNSLANFTQSLQNQLLSRITNSLIGNQFGEGSLRPGTYQFGSFQVEITNGADGVLLRIVDGKGGETSITIPYF